MAILLNPDLSANRNRLLRRTLAQLMNESPVTAKAGTVRQVTDYGGTIAVSDGVSWRLEQFYTTWENRPNANLIPAGTGLMVTGLNNAIFVSDGTYWKPRGAQNLYHKNGLLAAPLALLSGVTSGFFALPTMKIPAGLITPHSKLSIQISGRKTGTNATASMFIHIGTTNSSNDSVITYVGIPIATMTDFMLSAAAKFSGDTSKCLSQNWVGEGMSSFMSQNVQFDRTTNINTAEDMYINIGINGASTADSFAIQHIRVTYEA